MPNNAHIDNVIASIRGEIERTKTCGFNMNYAVINTDIPSRNVADTSGRDCGTVACIAGHAYLLSSKKRVPEKVGKVVSHHHDRGIDIYRIAGRYLGIDRAMAEDLFFAQDWGGDIEFIIPEHAIAVLENLKKTGKVEWSLDGFGGREQSHA